MPPNSFMEWVVGQNVVPREPVRKSRPVFAVELETDDESETDTLKVTYPRTGRRGSKKGKKVRFKEDTHRLKAEETPIQTSVQIPAHTPIHVPIQTQAQPPFGPDIDIRSTIAEVGTSEDEADTDEDLVPDCPCTNCIAARKKWRKTKQTKARSKQEVHPSANDSELTAAAVHARHKSKKAKGAEAPKHKAVNNKKKSKSRVKKTKEESDSESEASDATEIGTEEDTEGESEDETASEPEKKAQKKKAKKRAKSEEARQNSAAEKGKPVKQTKSNRENAKKQGEREDSHKRESKTDDESPREEHTSGDKERRQYRKALRFVREKAPRVPPGYPVQNRQGNFLMPVHSRVLQVEHAVEVPNDPRPNAFFDSVNGVMRVYHGPNYGNPYGAIYPNKVYGHPNPNLPTNMPQPPAQSPWYNGFPVFPSAQPAPFPLPYQQPQVPSQPPNQQPSGPQPLYQQSPATSPAAPAENQWFQGYGTVPAGNPPEEAPRGSKSATDRDQIAHEQTNKRHDTPTLTPAKPAQTTLKTSDRGGRSNIIPTVEGYDSPKTKGSKGARRESWGTQSVQGSRKSSGSRKGSGNGGKAANEDRQDSLLHKLDKMMVKDKGAQKSRSDYWSRETSNENVFPYRTGSRNGDIRDATTDTANQKNGWGDDNNNTATGVDSWGGNNDNEWGAGAASAFDPKTDDGEPMEWGKVTSPGPNGGNGGSPKRDGSNDSANNTWNDGTNDNSNKNGDDMDKKSDSGSKNSPQPKKSVPGGWVSTPLTEESGPTTLRASPDNVGWSGSQHGSKRGTPPSNAGGNGSKLGSPNNEGRKSGNGGDGGNVNPDGSGSSNGKTGNRGKGSGKWNGNGGNGSSKSFSSPKQDSSGGWGAWGDTGAAQSSGGAFDDDDKDKDNGNGEGYGNAGGEQSAQW